MKPIRITLDPEQSEILTDAGQGAFLVIGRGTTDSAGRWNLWIVPTTTTLADAGGRVARGLSAERKLKPTNPSL